MTQIDLTGKKALVTGGSQGIGAGICRELAACGADVLINYNSNKEKAKILAEEIIKEFGVKAHICKANVANATDVKNMFLAMDTAIGNIDILINNAGTESITHVLDLDEVEWDRVLNVNLKGPLLCSQQAARRMEKNWTGSKRKKPRSLG